MAANTGITTIRVPPVLGIVACSVIAFCYLTSEMLPIGLLPRIARSQGVSLPVAGLLLSAYALVVTLAGPPLTASLGAVPRKRLMLMLAAVLALSTALCALAQSYAFLMFARLLNALGHAVFWSTIAATAASLVAPEKRGSAVATVYAGSSIGIVLGVPLATFIGERFGWQAAFLSVAAVAAIAFTTFALMPAMPPARPSTLADVGRLLRNASFVRLLFTTVLVIIGNFTAFSYFTPLLQATAAHVAGGVPTLLLLYGIAGFPSTFVFGWIAQRNAVLAIVIAATLVFAALAALAVSGLTGRESVTVALAAVTLWGFGVGGTVVSLQARVLAAQPREPDVASALNSSAFNLGIAGGAIVGGLVLRFARLEAVPAIAALLVAPAIALQIVQLLRERHG